MMNAITESQGNLLTYLTVETTVETEDKSKDRVLNSDQGFFPVIESLFRYHTSGWIRTYEWQHSHLIRKKFLEYLPFPFNHFPANFYFINRFKHTVCTLTALNIFSLFAEGNSTPNTTLDFDRDFNLYKKKGVEAFKVELEKQHDVETGRAFLCQINHNHNLNSTFHEFIVEKTPSGKIYLYQSYVNEYTFYEGMKSSQLGPWDKAELIEKLSTIITTSKSKKETKKQAYKDLFNVSDDNLPSFKFFFIPITYNSNNIPTTPVSFSLTDRILTVVKKVLQEIKLFFYAFIEKIENVGDDILTNIKYGFKDALSL
jgi:hypothetical protein